MAKKSFSRRDFLKFSALGGTAFALSNCANMDGFFTGNSKNLKDEVLILGAGAAGLAAAFELKKRKVPYRIFEASSRVGGRVQTVHLLPEGGPFVELGAEFVDGAHLEVRNLAKELNLPLQEIRTSAGLEPHLFNFGGRTYRASELQSKMKTLQPVLRRVYADLFRNQQVELSVENALQFERSVYYDSLSLKDLLASWENEVDPLILKLIEVQAVNRFGVDASEQSSLHFLSTVDGDTSTLLTSRELYRFEGGTSELMQTLAARVGGVIPQQILKLESALTEIAEKKGIFQLTFQTPRGKETYQTSRIICALPFSKLRDVKGVKQLGLSEAQLIKIFTQDYATHSKGVVAFDSAFWKSKRNGTPANLGNFTGDFLSQRLWDSTRLQRDDGDQKTTQSFLSFQRGGRSGAEMGAQYPEQTLQDLKLFYKDVPAMAEHESINWSQRKWSAGSMAFFKPGQFTKLRGVTAAGAYDGQFLFAGEHTSLSFPGTIEGAIQSGLRAAREMG